MYVSNIFTFYVWQSDTFAWRKELKWRKLQALLHLTETLENKLMDVEDVLL